MTTYYLDSDGGNDANDGLSPATAWKTLPKYTSSMASGDRAVLRRGRTAAYGSYWTSATALHGTAAAPNIVEADYDDAWGDFAASAQTYTATRGSKTLEASASISDIAPGDWIFVQGDNARRFAYEVAGVSGTTLTLYLPFKGTPGSGLTLTIMPPIPTATMGTENRFNVWRGIRTTINFYTTGAATLIEDCVADRATAGYGIQLESESVRGTVIRKFRGYNASVYMFFLHTAPITVEDSYFDVDPLTSGGWAGFEMDSSPCPITVRNSEFEHVSTSTNALFWTYVSAGSRWLIPPMRFSGVTHDATYDVAFYDDSSENMTIPPVLAIFTDCNGSGRTIVYGGDAQPTAVSDPPRRRTLAYEEVSDTLRPGGAPVSLKAYPSPYLNPAIPNARFEALALPVYLAAEPTTITVYVKPDNPADWGANPTAEQLELSVETYDSAVSDGTHRVLSTDTVDMIGDAGWQPLTVSLTPARAGLVWVRLHWSKPRESGKQNVWYVDPQPVIT